MKHLWATHRQYTSAASNYLPWTPVSLKLWFVSLSSSTSYVMTVDDDKRLLHQYLSLYKWGSGAKYRTSKPQF